MTILQTKHTQALRCSVVILLLGFFVNAQARALAPAGYYYLCMALADGNGVAESDDTNNTMCSGTTNTIP